MSPAHLKILLSAFHTQYVMGSSEVWRDLWWSNIQFHGCRHVMDFSLKCTHILYVCLFFSLFYYYFFCFCLFIFALLCDDIIWSNCSVWSQGVNKIQGCIRLSFLVCKMSRAQWRENPAVQKITIIVFILVAMSTPFLLSSVTIVNSHATFTQNKARKCILLNCQEFPGILFEDTINIVRRGKTNPSIQDILALYHLNEIWIYPPWTVMIELY